jgi:hypothetical protein
VIVAVPVAARETHQQFKQQADEIVCVQTPAHFEGVGQWYEDFSQTSDEEVRALLEQGAKFGLDARRGHSERSDDFEICQRNGGGSSPVAGRKVLLEGNLGCSRRGCRRGSLCAWQRQQPA